MTTRAPRNWAPFTRDRPVAAEWGGDASTKEDSVPNQALNPRACRLPTAWPLVFGLFAGGAALAQSAPPPIAQCAAIASDSERLACYDRASGRAPAIAAQVPVAQGDAAQPVPPAAAAGATPSLIDAAWDFDAASPRFSIDLYNPNYLLFGRYSNNVNYQPFSPLFDAAQVPAQSLDSTEAKYQISFKARLWTTDDRRWGVWGAYTQQSNWQVYNAALSRPFRDTNYMPELFVSYRPGVDFGDLHWRLLNVGFNHESNGRSDVLSRSWNRLYAELGVESGNFALLAKAWYPLKESESDNPNITDYTGYGALTAIYKWHEHSFAAMTRGNVRTGKGAGEFTWTTPRLLGPLHGYVQIFSGYGESLIDYNWNQTTIGIGISLNDWL
jgi:phospholipase A1